MGTGSDPGRLRIRARLHLLVGGPGRARLMVASGPDTPGRIGPPSWRRTSPRPERRRDVPADGDGPQRGTSLGQRHDYRVVRRTRPSILTASHVDPPVRTRPIARGDVYRYNFGLEKFGPATCRRLPPDDPGVADRPGTPAPTWPSSGSGANWRSPTWPGSRPGWSTLPPRGTAVTTIGFDKGEPSWWGSRPGSGRSTGSTSSKGGGLPAVPRDRGPAGDRPFWGRAVPARRGAWSGSASAARRWPRTVAYRPVHDPRSTSSELIRGPIGRTRDRRWPGRTLRPRSPARYGREVAVPGGI